VKNLREADRTTRNPQIRPGTRISSRRRHPDSAPNRALPPPQFASHRSRAAPPQRDRVNKSNVDGPPRFRFRYQLRSRTRFLSDNPNQPSVPRTPAVCTQQTARPSAPYPDPTPVCPKPAFPLSYSLFLPHR
jgi:hypothetical protein